MTTEDNFNVLFKQKAGMGKLSTFASELVSQAVSHTIGGGRRHKKLTSSARSRRTETPSSKKEPKYEQI